MILAHDEPFTGVDVQTEAQACLVARIRPWQPYHHAKQKPTPITSVHREFCDEAGGKGTVLAGGGSRRPPSPEPSWLSCAARATRSPARRAHAITDDERPLSAIARRGPTTAADVGLSIAPTRCGSRHCRRRLRLSPPDARNWSLIGDALPTRSFPASPALCSVMACRVFPAARGRQHGRCFLTSVRGLKRTPSSG